MKLNVLPNRVTSAVSMLKLINLFAPAEGLGKKLGEFALIHVNNPYASHWKVFEFVCVSHPIVFA